MSLFKTREFWSVNCDDNEVFGENCLKISKLNSGNDFILVGSHEGVLRIYKPSCELVENVLSDYRATDLCIERSVNHPILMLDVGRLVSGSSLEQIAVLHPRSFAIYSFTTKSGITEHGNQNMINLLYEHKLRRSAYSFVLGPFGGSQNRDFIAVQSLDGMLSFFEQETFVFCCFLPHFLLPAPFLYAKRTDSFVVCASTGSVESYSYKMLSSIGQNSSENDVSGLKFEPDWRFNVSEGVLDVRYSHDNFSRESFVLVLGERCLYCLGDNGKLRFMKRLDYSPLCFTTYSLGEEKLISLVISENNTLLVYENTTVKWSAQLPYLPIAISRANFSNINGCLVTLTEDGYISCSYLGTQPSMFSAPPLINQEINFEQAESELATLNKIIRSHYNNDIKLTNQNADRELSVNLNVNPHLEKCAYEHNLHQAEDLMMCSLEVELVPQAIFEEIHVSVCVHKPLVVVPQVEFYENLSDRRKITCWIYMCDEAELVSLDASVQVSCVSNVGVPRVICKTIALPLKLVLQQHPAMKDNSIKITLNVNEPPVPLHDIFADLIQEATLITGSNSICLSNVSGTGSPVSILLAKSSDRYRLQSDSIAALNISVQELVRRLRLHHASSKKFRVSFTSSVPTSQLIRSINEHFEYRRKVTFLQNELVQLSAQFRIIQKRLITKFKDRNPTPLTNLDMLLNDTYEKTLDATAQLERANVDLLKSQTNLECGLKLVSVLLGLQEEAKDCSLIDDTLSPFVFDIDGQNWEDTIDASLSYLLRTVLAKSDKDKLRAAHTTYEEVKDLVKLEKHLSLVLERFAKKGIAVAELEIEQEQENEHVEITAQEDVLLPIGSRIGESSSRALSARKSLLRRRNRMIAE